MRHTDFSSEGVDSRRPEQLNSQENKSILHKGKNIPALLSIDKAAKISGLGRNNLAYLIKYHKLPVVKLPGYNRIKIHYDDLIQFIENNKCIYSGAIQLNSAGKQSNLNSSTAKRFSDDSKNHSKKSS